MDCTSIEFSRHAVQRLFQRGISAKSVAGIVLAGEVIEDYPTDFPYPSSLMLGFANGVPIHVVLARDPESGTCMVVTVYVPDTARWSDDFKSRRSR